MHYFTSGFVENFRPFTLWIIQIVHSTLWKISQSVFHIVDTISVSSTKLFNCWSFVSTLSGFHIVWNFVFNFLCTLLNINYFTSSFVENLNHSFRAVKSLHMVISTIWEILIVHTTLKKISQILHCGNYQLLFHKIILAFYCDNQHC